MLEFTETLGLDLITEEVLENELIISSSSKKCAQVSAAAAAECDDDEHRRKSRKSNKLCVSFNLANMIQRMASSDKLCLMLDCEEFGNKYQQLERVVVAE